MAGVPAKQIGWMSEYGERLQLPLKGMGSISAPTLSPVIACKMAVFKE